MLHYVAVHLGLHCLPKYKFADIQNEYRLRTRSYSYRHLIIYHDAVTHSFLFFISFMFFFLFCVCYAFVRVCLFVP